MGTKADGDHGTPDENAATRHLCAGVYLDPAFRRVVLRQVHNDARRMIAPSYGFDLVPVVRHAWRSWALEAMQHLCVLAVFTVGFMVNPPAIFTTASLLGLWFLTRLMVRSAAVVLPLKSKAVLDGWLRRARWNSEAHELRHQERLLRLSGIGFVTLVGFPFLLAEILQVSLAEMAASATEMALLIVLIVVSKWVFHQVFLNRMHGSKILRPQRLTRRERIIDEQQAHPYVVYRRPFLEEDKDGAKDIEFDLLDSKMSPFVGSGKLVHRWLPPLTIQLLDSRVSPSRPMREREHRDPEFSASKLVAHLKEAMKPMGEESDPAGLRGFNIRDRLYIAEADVPSYPMFLSTCPSRGDIDKIINNPHGLVHHFLEIRASVTGEVVATVFLRVSVKGRALSLDFAACALTRTPAEYHLLDSFAESGAGAVLRSAFRSFFKVPAEVARIWCLAEAPPFLIGAIVARKRPMPILRRGATVGAQLSVRQDKSTPWNQAQLDKNTIYDYMKLIEQRLLKATEDFLKVHHVDTSTFDKKASSIINMGLLNMGGNMDVKQAAVGVNAQVRLDTRESDGSYSESPVS